MECQGLWVYAYSYSCRNNVCDICSELGLNFQCWVDGFTMAEPHVLELCGETMYHTTVAMTNAYKQLVKTLYTAAGDPPFKTGLTGRHWLQSEVTDTNVAMTYKMLIKTICAGALRDPLFKAGFGRPRMGVDYL